MVSVRVWIIFDCLPRTTHWMLSSPRHRGPACQVIKKHMSIRVRHTPPLFPISILYTQPTQAFWPWVWITLLNDRWNCCGKLWTASSMIKIDICELGSFLAFDVITQFITLSEPSDTCLPTIDLAFLYNGVTWMHYDFYRADNFDNDFS